MDVGKLNLFFYVAIPLFEIKKSLPRKTLTVQATLWIRL